MDDSVIDLNYAFAAYKKSKGAANPQRKADAKVPSCLLAFIKEGDNGLEKAKKASNTRTEIANSVTSTDG